MGESIHLPAIDSWQVTHHLFDEESVWAVRAALAACRPLLVRGEPGIGKSQLARAAARVLEVPFLYHVVHERTEVGDLLYSYDAVSRLAQAQVAGASMGSQSSWEDRLAEERFIKPGVLWWAFNWQSAYDQARVYFRECPEPKRPKGWKPGDSCVVLIDEIDKADAAVPNSLLESLGNTGFQTPLIDRTVALPDRALPPLVLVTTNEERELPAAFLRRCLVLAMRFPEAQKEQEEFLLNRARVHFSKDEVGDAVCREAAKQLYEDREIASRHGVVRPGAAEYLDILRAVQALHPKDDSAQRKTLSRIAGFALRKNPLEDRLEAPAYYRTWGSHSRASPNLRRRARGDRPDHGLRVKRSVGHSQGGT